MMLLKKEWKLVMMPVPLLFLLLSALVLVPNYPYYVTFFYTTLGIFLMMQFARENRDLYYMALLPVTKRETPAGDAKCAKSDRKPHTSSWRLPDGSLKAATC